MHARLCGVAAFFVCSTAGAQKPCDHFPPAADSIAVQIQLVLRTTDTTRRINALDADEILRALAANMTLPSQLGLPIFSGSSDSAIKSTGVNYAWPQFTGRLRFEVRPGGKITGIVPTVRSMTPGLQEMLVHALMAVDSARMLNGMMIPQGGYSLEYQLIAKERSDSLSLVLKKTRFPAYRIEHLVQPAPDNAKPLYPEKVRMAGATGSANFVFVVGENGMIVPGTAIQTNQTFKELSEAVVNVLPKMRFSPGVAAGCPINVWVQQKFDFQLR